MSASGDGRNPEYSPEEAAMREALRELPEQMAWVLRRIDVERHDPVDVAREARWELEEVLSLLSHARARLSTLLDRGCGGTEQLDEKNSSLSGTIGEGSIQQEE